MRSRYWLRLIPILIIVAAAGWVVYPQNPGIHIGPIDRDIRIVRGLDLQGGLRVLLEADLPATTGITMQQMQTARDIVESRVNGLGVTEPLVQVAGTRRILVELPGIVNEEQAISTIRGTGLLEFVEVSSADRLSLQAGQTIQTDFGESSSTDTSSSATATGPAPTSPAGGTIPATTPPTPEASGTSIGSTSTALVSPSGQASSEPGPAASAPASGTTPQASAPAGSATSAPTIPATAGPTPETAPEGPVFHTVMTGAALQTAAANRDELGEYRVTFRLTDEGSRIFSDYTGTHIGGYLAIVLDKRIISIPVIENQISQGSGIIRGNFTYESANSLAVQLNYGALPIPLKVVDSKAVGPTLGQDSLRRSAIAGVIGLSVVVLFMALYYRLPGVLADLALLVYALVTFALFKLIPVTLTLPGIAGFVLSLGVAVDANVLIFERMKEELRAGRALRLAIDLGFSRAWPSIRDSNLSTLITCGILYWFGSTFGASIVKGFSLTLAIGVIVSLFTAITVTRTFLHIVLDSLRLAEHPRWFGI
jgi:preprotein translocase subunit SecD